MNDLFLRTRSWTLPLFLSFGFGLGLLGAYLSALWQMPLVDSLFSPICHQKAERCFHVDGVPWAICSRCAGIYFGVFLGALLGLLLKRFSIRALFWLLGASLAINGLEFLAEHVFRWYSNSLEIRSFAGLLLGLSVGILVARILNTSFQTASTKH